MVQGSRVEIVSIENLIPDFDSSRILNSYNIENFRKTYIPFSELLLDPNTFKDCDSIEKTCTNQVLIDIGAGICDFGYRIALKTNAKAYIGVEKFHPEGLLKTLQAKSDYNRSLIPAAIADEDMLDFLRCVPDNSASILASGIDNFIMNDSNYETELRSEMKRVLGHDHTLYGVGSFFIQDETRITHSL